MTTGGHATGQTGNRSSAGQATSEPIPDELEAMPDPVLELPPVREPDLLPLRALEWVDFERLCVRLARHVEGLRNVRMYGRRGQNQRGLDLFGIEPSDNYVVYQARDIERLTGPALKQAVDDYMNRGRAFGARRFVLAVACDVRDTKVDEELVAARKRYPDLDIELLDAERITDLLRGQREIVEQFFTSAWADIFSPAGGGDAAQARPVRSIDALLHGPLVALGRTADLERADEIRENDPAEAALIYGRLRQELEGHGYQGHAAALWENQAAALEEAGETGAAFDERLEMGVRRLERGHSLQLTGLATLAEDDDRRTAMVAALAAAYRWFDQPAAIDELAEAMVVLEALDESEALRAATWFAERAIADRRFDLVSEHEALLARLAAVPDALRLRLAVAEIGDGTRWAEIGHEGLSRAYPAALSALCCMRAGRHAVWHAEPETANTLYRRAVELTTQAGLFGDAFTSLRATIGIAFKFATLDPWQIQDTLNVANAVDSEPTLIESRLNARATALLALDDQKIPEAHRLLRRLLHLAVVAGDFMIEIEARRRLGRLYESIGMVDAAVSNYVLAGADKEARAVAPRGELLEPDEWIDHPAPWVRAAGWAVVQAQADRLPDAQVDSVAARAIRDMAGVRQSRSGAQVYMVATEALASLSWRLTLARATSALEEIEPWIERDPATHRLTDDAMVEVFASIQNSQPDLQGRADEALLRAFDLVGDPLRVASVMMRSALASSDLVAGLTECAAAGNGTAADVLAYFDVAHDEIRRRGEDKAREILAVKIDPARTSWGVGAGYWLLPGHVRSLTPRRRGDLARKLVELAEDATDIEVTRAQALDALTNIAGALSTRQRADIFPRVFALASGDPELNAIDQANELSLHPLSRHRISLAPGAIRSAALRCAAQFATTRRSARQCQVEAQRAGRSGQSDLVISAAWAFASTASLAPIDPSDLLVDPAPTIRRAGIAVWAQNPSRASNVPDLTADPDPTVRLELAAHLDELDANGAAGVAALRNRLREDASATVRRRALRSVK
jgi:hypothetical protein